MSIALRATLRKTKYNQKMNEVELTDAGLNTDPVSDIASRVFGIPYVYPWQRLVMANILDAWEAARQEAKGTACEEDLRDQDGRLRGRQIVLLPTGAGKSLCFQIPALMLDGPTLVVYPLLSLMGDQLRRMEECGLEPAVFRGSQSAEEREAQYKRLLGQDGKKGARLIIANPEILAQNKVLDRLSQAKIAHLAIDEAHCVSEWGDSFRPSYLELGKVIETLNPPCVSAFTATASPPVLSRIAEVLFGNEAHLVRGDSDRPNISYSVRHAACKEAALAREVHAHERPMIVFCSTRGRCEKTALFLSEVFSDPDIRFYHAGMTKEEKHKTERWFMGAERGILVATVAFGMGVDKKNIRTVIHRDPSPTAEAYVQEAGRGGRDGEAAQAVLLWNKADTEKISRIANESERMRALTLVHLATAGKCRREVLLAALGDGERGTACSGCDVCSGRAYQGERDRETVLDFIAKNPLRYTKGEATGILHASANRISMHRQNAWLWRRSDFTGIIEVLEKEGFIRERKKGLWKGRLSRPI